MTAPKKPASDGTRLNVYLQERGIASRRKADTLIEDGHVTVDGKVITTLGFRVPKGALVTLDGKPVVRTVPHQTYLFFKPDLYLTSRADPGGRQTIFDLPDLKKLPRNVQAVGRLDFRSEGLLLLTNDGDLAYALTHPRFSVEKKYACLLSDLIAPDEVERLRKGVELEDGPARPISVRIGAKENLGAGKKGHWVEVVVTEGRNRLIRRMLDTLGHKVIRLVRMAIGEVELPLDMKSGDLRPLTGRPLEALEKIRDEFLSSDSGSTSEKKSPARPRRPKRLNDEQFAEERVRRSIVSKERESKRLEKRQARPEGSTRPTAERSARLPRSEGNAQVEPTATKGSPRRRSGEDASGNGMKRRAPSPQRSPKKSK